MFFKLKIQKYWLLAIGCWLLAAFSYSQQTEKTFYDKEKKNNKEISHIKKVSGKIIKDGLYQIYYENGKIWQEGNYKDDKLNGEWKIYYNNGQLKQILFYENGLSELLKQSESLQSS